MSELPMHGFPSSSNIMLPFAGREPSSPLSIVHRIREQLKIGRATSAHPPERCAVGVTQRAYDRDIRYYSPVS